MNADNRPVVILGAGINGAALARELALNGVDVVLVDTADVACGTTAYSSRLIHGGLRYLEYGEFSLVRESLEERNRLLQLAPQYVRPLRLQIPISRRTGGWGPPIRRFLGGEARSAERGLWLVRAGLTFYDLYARDSRLPRHTAFRVGTQNAIPVDPRRYRWLCAYWDAQILYPERFVVALAEDARALAEARGTHFELLTYTQVHQRYGRLEARPTGRPDGDPTRVIDPAAIVNATGAWVDLTLEHLGVAAPPLIGGTKGSHFLTFHRPLVEALSGQGVYAEAPDGRPVFVLPWDQGALVGTTDIPFAGDPASVVATDAELDYLVAVVDELFPQVGLTRADIHLSYAGVRPLPRTGGGAPASVTRRHWMQEHPGGSVPLYSIVGGKLTTCRSLAEQSAETILRRLGRQPSANSRQRPIPGGEAYPGGDVELAAAWQELANRFQTSPAGIRAIWTLCGSRTARVLESLDERPGPCVADTLLPRSLVQWIIQHEWVATLDDLVERRLMLLYDPELSRATLAELASLLRAAGKLEDADLGGAVAATERRLGEHFGKSLSETNAAARSSATL